ncbi:hypothetical protein HDV01_007580 [Terramyces sp. JEL0728]|nr:hypothetical protein HDV01_007580 [Terramyces sp. JEL0728]
MKIYLLIATSHTNTIEATDNPHCVFDTTCNIEKEICTSACLPSSTGPVIVTPVLYSVKEIVPSTTEHENTLADGPLTTPTSTTAEIGLEIATAEESKETQILFDNSDKQAAETNASKHAIETVGVVDNEKSEELTEKASETSPVRPEEPVIITSKNETLNGEQMKVNETTIEIPINDSSVDDNTKDEDRIVGLEQDADLVILNETEKESEKKENITIEIPKKKTGFNYASFDCGALILGANKEAKYPKAILLNSKDEYMLSPCDAKKYVEIELCQNILVNSISLANFEYFSSMFKDFKLYGSSKLPDWKLLGAFQAKNVRDRQVFNLDDSVLWTKYLRIEFDTYYGSEYYCPVTSVQVYGISMMEQAQDLEIEMDNLNTTEIVIQEVRSLIRPELPFSDVCINEEKPKEKQNNIFTKIIKRLNQLEQTTTNLDLYYLELSYNVKRNSKTLSENRFQKRINEFEQQMNEKLNAKNKETEARMEQIQALMESLDNQVTNTNIVEMDPILEQGTAPILSSTCKSNVQTAEIVNKSEVKEKVEYVIKEVTEKVGSEVELDEENKDEKKTKKYQKKKQKLI